MSVIFDGPAHEGKIRPAKPCRPEAQELAGAILGLVDAAFNLVKARAEVPEYLPTTTPEDEVAAEQEAFNEAADHLYSLIEKAKAP